MDNDPVKVLRDSHELLRATVTPLTPEQLREPAYPSEWSIAQVLSHIGSGAEITLLAIAAAEAGSEPPTRDANFPIWDRWNAKSPDDQVADGLASDAALVAAIERLRGSDLRYHLWSGPVDAVEGARARLFEHALHTWDVVVALDPSATLPREPVEIILPELGRLVRFAAKPKDLSAHVHVVTTDPDADYLLTLGERSAWAPWEQGVADAELRAPAEAVVRLVYGRLDPAHTPAGVVAEGIDLDQLRAAFPGF